MKVALLGFGTVGYGTYELLEKLSEVEVKTVLDIKTHPEISAQSTTDINDVLSDKEIDAVVELIGGEHPAFDFIEASLKAGKNVITANKLVISKYYDYLSDLAKENGVVLRYTAAVGGGIPWLVNLERLKRNDNVLDITGIFNGTTNYILDSMHHSGTDFDVALKEAQKLGFAEADPSSDIDGLDTLRKIVISANIAFGVSINNTEFDVMGIGNITKKDIENAEKEGYVCRLLARAMKNDDCGVSVFVEPVFVAKNNPFANVTSSFNRISVVSEVVGVTAFYGYGAGRYPTANTVVNDCIDLSNGCRSAYNDNKEPCMADNTSVRERYYLRMQNTSSVPAGFCLTPFADGYITKEVSVKEMHELFRTLKKNNTDCFVAAVI